MKTLEQLGISPAPWSIDYDYDDGVPYRVNCTRPRGLSNRVFDDCDGILDADALLIAAAPELYKSLREAIIEICHDCPDCDVNSDYKCSNQNCVGQAALWRAALAKASGESEVKE